VVCASPLAAIRSRADTIAMRWYTRWYTGRYAR
jgi:hypothetical protein